MIWENYDRNAKSVFSEPAESEDSLNGILAESEKRVNDDLVKEYNDSCGPESYSHSSNHKKTEDVSENGITFFILKEMFISLWKNKFLRFIFSVAFLIIFVACAYFLFNLLMIILRIVAGIALFGGIFAIVIWLGYLGGSQR